MRTVSADERVDARGLLCPIPTVKASLALEALAPGQVLEVAGDDPVTRRDLPQWARESGHEVVDVLDDGASFRVYLRKLPGGPRP
jgi:tRNA 2-thiouridine synthesizing protein A